MISAGMAFIGLLASAAPPPVQEPSAAFPDTPAEFYDVGQAFAHCSGHWAYAAELANRNGLTAAATSLEGMERGWTLAGMTFLVEGLDPSRQTEVETLFENMKQIEVERLRAEREIADARGDTDFPSRSGERFEAQCGRWIELQRAMIQAMRSGPISPP
ncbi:MAG: hypothetical protein IM674_03910 [Brevundimonas sp.]|nr:hypothetical protein [Brevundimonas sp.]